MDFNQIMISNLMIQLSIKKQELHIDLIRHMVLNSLRKYRMMFKEDYGEMIICCDGVNPWRKDIFPQYKANRRKTREESKLEWDLIFLLLNGIRDEIKENLPYRVIHIDNAEADDIIAVLIKKIPYVQESFMIISTDKDFRQLQKIPRVSQYSPIQKKIIEEEDPHKYIKEHILLGDTSDGIPNFLSPDDTFINGIRQKPINRKKLSYWIDSDPKGFCNEYQYRNYQRNQRLIDFDFIPEEIEENIMQEYENVEVAPREGVLNYFIHRRLKELMSKIQEF